MMAGRDLDAAACPAGQPAGGEGAAGRFCALRGILRDDEQVALGYAWRDFKNGSSRLVPVFVAAVQLAPLGIMAISNSAVDSKGNFFHLQADLFEGDQS